MRKVLFSAAIVIGFVGPAFAVDFAQLLKTLDGTVIRDGAPPAPGQVDARAPLSLADVVTNSLMTDYRDETNAIDGMEKNKRYFLAKKIYDNQDNPSLSAEDIALIKKLVPKLYNPLVAGQTCQMIDPEHCLQK